MATAPVELLRGPIEADRPLLDQVEKRKAHAAVALRDRGDEPQVRLDHAMLRLDVASLDSLGERNLLGRGQQGVQRDLAEEQLEAIWAWRDVVGAEVAPFPLGFDHPRHFAARRGASTSGRCRTRRAENCGERSESGPDDQGSH